MDKKIKNICILAILFLLAMFVCINPAYAATSSDKQELVGMLNQYKNDLGDLEQLKTVVDKIYSDVNSASSVDDNLKQTLKSDIDMLDNVSGMNSLILTVLKSELTSQIDQLDDSNLDELKDEVQTIKDWVDEQVGDDSGDDDNPIDTPSGSDNSISGGITGSNSTTKSNTTTKGNTVQIPANGNNKTFMLPDTGTGRAVLVIFVVLAIAVIGSIIKYQKLKDVK